MLLFCIVLLVCWKVYITNRVGPNSPGQRKRSNRNLHCRLELPQTEELLDSSEQHYCTYEYKLESGQLHESGESRSVLILQEYNYSPFFSAVPYDDTLDNPPIPNSVPQFNHSATPKHDANSRGPYANGIGLGINVNLNHDLPLPQHLESPETTTWVEKIEKDVNAKISKY